jgi:hypothetical protein
VYTLGVSKSEGQVTRIVGGQAECDTALSGCIPIPLVLSLLCNGAAGNLNCPQYFAPDRSDTTGQTFYGINNNGSPARCVKSTNGGSVWSACASNPFATSIAGVYFGVASNGTLIASTNTATNTCEIKISTNGGVSWSTVFTQATLFVCGGGGISETSSLIKCDAATNYCVILSFDQSVFFNVIPINSTNNGASWAAGTTIALGGSNGGTSAGVWGFATNDSQGIVSGVTMRSTAHATIRSGNNYVIGPVMSNFGADTATNGCAAIINNGITQLLCSPESVAPTVFTLRDTTGLIVSSHAPFGAPARANGPSMLGISFAPGIIYTMAVNQLNTTQYRIWVSTDNYVSSVTLGLITLE